MRALPTGRLRAWPPEKLLGVGLFACYLALLKGHLDAVDGLLMFRQGAALVLHGSIHLVPSVVWSQQFTDSKYGIGQSLAYAPFIGIGHLFGLRQAGPSTAGTFRQYYADPLWTVACSWINCAVTAVTACYVGKCLRALDATKGQIMLGVVGFGLGSPALTYSSSSFAQPLTALMCVLAATSLLRWSTNGASNRLLLAVAIAGCLITRPVEGVVLGLGSAAFLGLRRAHWSAWLWPVAGFGLGIAIDLVVDQLRFGSAFQSGYGQERWHPTIAGVLGLSISPGRGIVWYMPFCILVPWGLVQLFKRGRSFEACWLAAIAMVLFLNAALWDIWWGGFDWGPRLLVPALPLVAVIAASAVNSRATLAFAAASVVCGFVLLLPTVLVDLLVVPAASSHANFQMSKLPMLTAWRFVRHIVPRFATDRNGIDVIWVRLVHHGGPAALLVPLALLSVTAWCFTRAVRTPTTEPGPGKISTWSPGGT